MKIIFLWLDLFPTVDNDLIFKTEEILKNKRNFWKKKFEGLKISDFDRSG